MYHSYFGLREPPFSIAVDPRYLFMSERHRDALAHLLYGVGVGGGFILLTGEVGTGKTTINRCLLEQLPAHTDVALILNPALDAVGLLSAICDELAMVYSEREHTLKGLTDRLHGFLLDNHQRGRNTVLLIDEAQHLKPEVLEQIRLLTNLETSTQKLLQIILVGQPELKAVLDRPELRQLSQRITARYQLRPLTLQETRDYIEHRLQVAGLPAGQTLFPPRVIRQLHRESGGIPRLINVYCDRALLGAYGRHQRSVDMAMLRQALREVRGEDFARQPFPWMRPALAGAALLALVGAAAWWRHQPPPVVDPSLAATAVVEGESVVVDRSAPVIEPPQSEAAEAAPTEQAELAQQPSVTQAAPAAAAPSAAVGASPVRPQRPAAASVAPAVPLRGTRTQTLAALLQRQGDLADAVDNPCAALARQDWRCEDLVLEDWSGLLAINRPVALQLREDDGRVKWVALTGIEAEDGLFLAEQGLVRMPLQQVGEQWTGALTLPWRAPPGFSSALVPGSRGATVAWLSESFAKLDGQASGLADGVYNELLEQRVRMFQRQERLRVDGIAGLATLLRVDQRLGNGHLLVKDVVAGGGAG